MARISERLLRWIRKAIEDKSFQLVKFNLSRWPQALAYVASSAARSSTADLAA